MHVITVTRRTAAQPEVIWRLWADVPNRTRWDDALERRFEVVQCVPSQAHTDRFFLPLVARWTGLTPSARWTASVR